jgi:hypothetical protein
MCKKKKYLEARLVVIILAPKRQGGCNARAVGSVSVSCSVRAAKTF